MLLKETLKFPTYFFESPIFINFFWKPYTIKIHS